MDEHVYSPTQLDTFTICQRKYYYSYIERIVPIDINWSLAGGTMIHAALEGYYATRDMKTAIQAALTEAELISISPDFTLDDEELRDLYLSMVKGFIPAVHRYYKDFDKFNILAVETVFEHMRIEGYIFKCILDLVISSKSGKVFVVDHKSTTRLTKGLLASLPMQYQSVIYPEVASFVAGKDVRTMIYNYLIKPDIRRKTTERVGDFHARITNVIAANPEKYLKRAEIPVNADLRKPRLRDIGTTCGMINEKLGQDFRSKSRWICSPKACNMFGTSCEYLPKCMGEKNTGGLYKKKEDK